MVKLLQWKDGADTAKMNSPENDNQKTHKKTTNNTNNPTSNTNNSSNIDATSIATPASSENATSAIESNNSIQIVNKSIPSTGSITPHYKQAAWSKSCALNRKVSRYSEEG